MVDLANRAKEPLQEYMCYWIAFNNIYNEIARHEGINPGGQRNRIAQARAVFTPDLEKALIQHSAAEYFVNRVPTFGFTPIEYTSEGQRPNGVLDVGTTRDRGQPKWSGINIDLYRRYHEGDLSDDQVDMLVKEIVDVLYMVRNNLFHGDKRADRENERVVVSNALHLLRLIVESFMELGAGRD